MKDNPKSVTIDSKGNLCVDKDCEIDKVIIVSTGKAGTDYEGKTAEKTVAIIMDGADPGPGGVPPVGDDIPVVPLVLASVIALAGAVLFTRLKRV